MPYIVDPKNQTIEETHVAIFQEMGLRERRDLERWVIDSPEILVESLLAITSRYGGFASGKKGEAKSWKRLLERN